MSQEFQHSWAIFSMGVVSLVKTLLQVGEAVNCLWDPKMHQNVQETSNFSLKYTI